MSRAQAIVYRGDRVLMVKHRNKGEEWWCLPGGGFLENEAPEAAAIRELREECCVHGSVIRKTSVVSYGAGDKHHTFLVDIGEQEAKLGLDPEHSGIEPKLVNVRWMELAELPERDRAYLWGAGAAVRSAVRGTRGVVGSRLELPGLAVGFRERTQTKRRVELPSAAILGVVARYSPRRVPRSP